MDQNTAKRLFENGAVFIFLDVPEGTEFGIDMKSWNTGERFRGVKMIPPGVHYIFYSSVGSTGDAAPRSGFFYNFRPQEVLVKKWDKAMEDISNVEVPEGEIVKLKENLKSLDAFLGPYPYDILEKWTNLTRNIKPNLIKKLTPACGVIRSALELENCTDADRPRTGNNSDTPRKRLRVSESLDELLPNLKAKEGTEIRITSFPDRTYPENATPAEITQHSLDYSYVFDSILASYENCEDLLGEYEFCYISFLVGHSLEAFEQWKKIFNLFCSCEKALKKHRKLFDLFISCIELQVTEIPEEFLADIVSNNNFVYVKLRHLFSIIKNSQTDGQLKMKTERLMESLHKKYLWDFNHLDSEDEDEASVVVDLEEIK